MTDTAGARNGSVQGALSDADVEQVVRLVDSLDRSGFDFLEVQVGELKVTIGKGEPPAAAPAQAAVPAPAPAPHVAAAPVAAPAVVPPAVAPSAVAPPAVAPPAVAPPAVAPPAVAPAATGLREITAPTMGIFYAQPEPGKPPFVTEGALVEESTTVALVEVMKTFHAVAAGVRGTVVEVCVSDAQLVEFGQVLFRVDPGA